MDKVRVFLTKLSELFTSMIRDASFSDEISAQVTKNSQYLAASFKYAPEIFDESDFIELLCLYCSPCENDSKELFFICKGMIDICLKEMTPQVLQSIWVKTSDIGLCDAISKRVSLEAQQLFMKLSFWIENPEMESSFFRHFLSIVRSADVENVKTDYALPFAAVLADNSIVRSSLARIVLSRFSNINEKVSNLIAAAWLLSEPKTPHSAYNCRTILEKSKKASLNLYSTICLEHPYLFCILPQQTAGYSLLSRILIHQISVLNTSELGHFLSLCPTLVRHMYPEESKSSPTAFQLYDCSQNTSLSVQSHFDAPFSPDIFGASIVFARDTNRSPHSITSTQTIGNIIEAMKNPTEFPQNQGPISSELEKISRLSDFLSNKDVVGIRECLRHIY